VKPALASGKARIDDFLPQLCMVASVHMEAGDFAKAKECFELLGSRGLNHWDPTNGVNYWQAFGLSSALSGSAAQEVANFHAAVFMSQDEARTVEELDDLKTELAALRKTDPQPSSEFYFKEAEKVLDQLKAYAAGEWVHLTFDDSLHGWIVIAESVKVEDDRTVVLGSSSKKKNATIQPTARFRPPFVVEAEITTGNLLDPQAYAGIMVGSKTWTRESSPQIISAGPDGYYVDVEQLHKRIKGDLSSSLRRVAHRRDNRGYVPLSIRQWPGALQFIAWHREIHSDLNYELPPNDHLHFGNVLGGGSTRLMKIRNVRIRRLAIGPPREKMSDEEQLEYHRRALEEMPNSAFHVNAISQLLVAAEEWEEALRHLKLLEDRGVDVMSLNRMLAKCYLNLHEYELALEHLEKEMQTSTMGGSYADCIERAWLLAGTDDETKQKGRKAHDLLQIVKRDAKFRKANEFRIALTTAAVEMQREMPEPALKAAEEAVALAKNDEEKKLAEEVMNAAKSGKPYRLPVKSK
jgi:tetratricopeptide (TPR) repeat protein